MKLKDLLVELLRDSPEFKSWFGNSKVVDDKGNPLVVYHATQGDFEDFSEDKIGTAIDYGTIGRGFYFTSDTENVNNYARNLPTNTGKQDGTNIVQVYLKITKPYEVSSPTELSGMNEKESSRFADKLKQKGYDGVKVEFGYPDTTTWWVAFESTQIKSIFGK